MRPIYLAMLLACISIQAQAQDLLNPMALGESMSMPLPPDLLRQAENAGVKVGTGVTGGSQSSQTPGLTPVALGSEAAGSGFAGTDPWSSAGSGAGTQALDDQVPSDMNVSGMWTFTLQDDLTRRLDVALFQNGGTIFGYGNLEAENSTRGVTAGGSVDDGRVSILITSQGGLSMYRLDMMPSESALSGSYSAFSSSGETWSGTVFGSMPGQKPLSSSSPGLKTGPEADPQLSSAKATLSPAKLGGASSTVAQTSTSSSAISSVPYGSSSRSGSAYSGGGMSSSQSISMGSGGSYSSVSSISSAVYG